MPMTRYAQGLHKRVHIRAHGWKCCACVRGSAGALLTADQRVCPGRHSRSALLCQGSNRPFWVPCPGWKHVCAHGFGVPAHQLPSNAMDVYLLGCVAAAYKSGCVAVAYQIRTCCRGIQNQDVLPWHTRSRCVAVAYKIRMCCRGIQNQDVLPWHTKSGCVAVAYKIRMSLPSGPPLPVQ